MTVSDRYRKAWDGYWEQSNGEPGEPFWDADASLTAERDIALLAPHADPALPLADLGCGNGTQTRHLATRFAVVVGVDLCAAAVAHARRADPAGTATYEQLNLADDSQAHALHDRLGDTHVYMRAVLHQSDPEDRPAVAACVATLVGDAAGRSSWNRPARPRPFSRTTRSGPAGPPRSCAASRSTTCAPARSPTARSPGSCAAPACTSSTRARRPWR